MTSLVAQMVKCLPTMRETWVQSLGQEDLLEKEMAIHSSTLAWKIPRMDELGRLQSMGSQRVGHEWVTSLSSFFLQLIRGFPVGTSGKEASCQCRRFKRHGFHPWFGKISCRRSWQLTPVLLPGESHGHRRLAGYSP